MVSTLTVTNRLDPNFTNFVLVLLLNALMCLSFSLTTDQASFAAKTLAMASRHRSTRRLWPGKSSAEL